MKPRALFNAIMRYRTHKRMPVFHWTGRPETAQRSRAEGMPDGVSEQALLLRDKSMDSPRR